MIPGIGLLARVPVWAWVIIVLSIALGITTKRLERAHTELGVVRTTLTVAQDANDSQRLTIAELRAANAAFADKCSATNAEREAAIKTLRDSESAARHRATMLDREIRRLAHDDATVDALLRTPVPGALADRMRRDAADRPN